MVINQLMAIVESVNVPRNFSLFMRVSHESIDVNNKYKRKGLKKENVFEFDLEIYFCIHEFFVILHTVLLPQDARQENIQQFIHNRSV